MANTHIAIVVGSIRKDSFNRKLGEQIVSMLPAGFDATFVRIDDLPLYNQDDDGSPAPAVTRLRDQIKAAHGVIFITPEYNRSFPGVLKNAIDHASRPYGKSVWNGKPAGVIGVSVGAIGTALAQQHLRNVLSYLNMPQVNQPEAFLNANADLFAADGSLSEKSRGFVQAWVDAFVALVRKG